MIKASGKIASLFFAAAFCCSQLCYSQPANDVAIKTFLAGRHSFNTTIDTTALPFVARRLDVTSFSLLRDGKEMIGAADQGVPVIDSMLSRLMAFVPAAISSIKNEGATEYYKLIKTDSVLCIRYASIGIPLSRNVDSIFNAVNMQLQSGTRWNDLSFHLTDTYQQVRGGSGWMRASLLTDTFLHNFSRHKKGHVFLVKDDGLRFAWIIYKTDDEQLFERKQFIFAADRTH